MRNRKLSLWMLAAAVAAAVLPEAGLAQARVEVPISQTRIGGSVRYSIPVRIGEGPEIQAMLDTGSVGLRILPRVTAKSSGIDDTGQPTSLSYGSGVLVNGTVGKAAVRVGAAATGGPIALQLAKQVTCVARQPKCPASRVSIDRYGFGGNGVAGKGFAAILGARLAAGRDGVGNPLAAIGAARWIVELPQPGSGAGRLVLNPGQSDLRGFTMISLKGTRGGMVPGCITNERNNNTFCGPILPDTGAGAVNVTTDQVNGSRNWPGGTPGKLTFGSGNTAVAMNFTAGGNVSGHHVHVSPSRGGSTQIVAGFLPFLSFSIYFDAENQIMGFRKRN